MSEEALQPTEQKKIVFYDDEVTAVQVEDGTVYVPVRPICELIGVAWQPQARKINNDPVLSDVATSVTIRLQKSGNIGTPTAEMVALPLDYLNGWLFGINANRVKAEIRDSLIRYQKDCYKVLSDAFGRGLVTARPSAIDTADDPVAIAYRNAVAVANLAREQWESNQRMDTLEIRIDAIEAQLGDPSRLVTSKQTSQIKDAVGSLAMAMGEKSGKNEFGGVWWEIHRRFKVPSYRELRANDFEKVMSFLRQWYQSIIGEGDEIPF